MPQGVPVYAKGRCHMCLQLPPVPGSVALPGFASVAAERDAWRVRTRQRQQALSPVLTAVPRIRGPVSAETFLDLFYAPGIPVVIEGLAAKWPAVRQWTTKKLARKVGSAEITYQGGRNSAPDFEIAKTRHTRTMPFDAYIDMVTSADTGNDAYITAYNNVANTVALQPLMGDFGPVPFLDERIGSIWIGPKGTFTPLHHDLNNNLLVQLMGTKRLFLLPPDETSKLANNDFVFSDVHDIMSDDKVAQYPEVLSARCYHVDIHPGDALFMPVGWWHQVEALSFSAMLTYHNFIWPNDAFRDFPPNR